MAHQENHRIRRNMAGLLEKTDILERIVEALETSNERAFKQACRDAGVTNHVEVIDDAEIFIDQLWRASMAARQAQSMQPCW